MSEHGTGSAGEGTPSGEGGANGGLPSKAAVGQDITERLAALDALYEGRHITAVELGEARRELLSSTTPPVAGAAAGAQPRALADGGSGDGGGPRSPRAITGSQELPEPSPSKRVAGLPIWAAATIAGVAIVGVIGLVAFLSLRGGDMPATTSAPSAAYAAQISAPLRLLNASAVATGKALALVSGPSDIKGFHRTAKRQLDVVEEARARLATIDVAAPNERAQGRLVAAAAAQRHYVVELGRASAGEPGNDNLAALNRARQAGGQTVSAYSTFFALMPDATDVITGTDLTDTSGLRSALSASIAASKAPPVSTARATPIPVPVPAPPVTQTGAGINFDVVANSGGEGVRYRYSAQLADLVPGNGPMEGDQLSISCFTPGEVVRSNVWWAYLTNGYYVPATYLLYSGSGPVAGARYC